MNMLRTAISGLLIFSWMSFANAAIIKDPSAAATVVQHNPSNGTTVTLTVTNANDVLVACAFVNWSNSGFVVSSITDNTGVTGTWTQRSITTAGGAFNTVECWSTVATAAFASKTITFNTTDTGGLLTAVVWGVSGANTSTPYDTNVALPALSPSQGTDPSVSTSNANDFIFSCEAVPSTGGPTAGTGFTQIASLFAMLCQYKIVSATQSSLAMSIGTGSTDTGRYGIGDAIMQAGGGPVGGTLRSMTGVGK